MKKLLSLAVSCLLITPAAFAATRWIKVSSPHVTVFTSDSKDKAKEWVTGIEAFRLSLNELAPTDERSLEPMTMVVFDRLKAYEQVIPNQAKGEKKNRKPLSNFVSRSGHFYLAVNGEETVSAQHSVYHQAAQWLTNSYARPLPLWVVTGLQGVYARNDLSGGRMMIGYTDEAGVSWLKNGKLLPLEQLFGMTTAGETYQSEPGQFNAQAWSFVHYLLIGDKGANRPKLARFMKAIMAGRSEADALQEAFPEGTAELTKSVSRYARRSFYIAEPLPVDLRQIEQGIRTAPATEAEVQLALGYLHLYFQNAAIATPYFERVLALAPAAPSSFEAMGELARSQNNESESRRRYQQAVMAGSTSPVAHLRAVYPTVQAMYGLEAAADHVDQAKARAAVDSIERILRLRPGFGAAHEALAGLAGSLAVMTEEDAKWLKEGVERFSDDARVQAGMVAYEIIVKRYAPAKARLDRLYAGEFAHSDRVENYVKKLDVRLAAVNDLYWCERYFAEQKTAEAAKFLPKLERAPLLPAERERFAGVRSALMTQGTLKRVGELIAQRNWSLANVLLDNLAADNPAEAVRAEIVRLRAQARPENEKAPAEAGAGN